MPFEVSTITMVKDLGALAVLLCFLIWFARIYLKNVADIAKTVNDSTLQHIQVLTKVADALGELTLHIMLTKDAVLKCQGPNKGDHNERK